jgi:hypothetical protein
MRNSDNRGVRSGAFAISETEVFAHDAFTPVSVIGKKPPLTLAISGHNPLSRILKFLKSRKFHKSLVSVQ